MNIKPFRDIDEHNVINQYSTVEGTVNKGSFVQVVSYDPDNHSGPGASMPDVPDYAYSVTYEVYAKVKLAQGVSGVATGVLGITLSDVVPHFPSYVVTVGDQLAYFDKIPSGKAVPILTRGLVEIGGFSGSPYPGAKGVVGTDGQLVVAAANTAGNVGTFLSSSGADGYALFMVHCI